MIRTQSEINFEEQRRSKQKTTTTTKKQHYFGEPCILEEIKTNFIILANTKQSRVKIQKILSPWIGKVALHPALRYTNTYHIIKYSQKSYVLSIISLIYIYKMANLLSVHLCNDVTYQCLDSSP